MGQSEQRTMPTQDDIVNNLYTDFEIEPYTMKRNGVLEGCLSETDAISLINMYRSNLMKSKFTNLVPIWKLYEKNSKIKLFRVVYIFFTI